MQATVKKSSNQVKAAPKQTQDDSSENESEEDSEEMNDFIAPDFEVEAEQRAELDAKRKKRALKKERRA